MTKKVQSDVEHNDVWFTVRAIVRRSLTPERWLIPLLIGDPSNPAVAVLLEDPETGLTREPTEDEALIDLEFGYSWGGAPVDWDRLRLGTELMDELYAEPEWLVVAHIRNYVD